MPFLPSVKDIVQRFFENVPYRHIGLFTNVPIQEPKERQTRRVWMTAGGSSPMGEFFYHTYKINLFMVMYEAFLRYGLPKMCQTKAIPFYL
ncbi:MAG: hypothetical protein DDT19_02522 [Syntrophomonadaceae bacterium]|nr:hypothetical protein [Bacillota bacterium]